jgi:hypothetical protein
MNHKANSPGRSIEDVLMEQAQSCTVGDLLVAVIRYNALRRIGPTKFAELHKRNLAGENFDTMVTQLAVDWANDKV